MAKKKNWTEAELVLTFGLQRIVEYATPLMQEWLATPVLVLSDYEQVSFDNLYQRSLQKISTWSEEDLKMKFISFLLELGQLTDFDRFVTFFDKKISAKVGDIQLSVKSDFMVATGFMNLFKNPYFHFQEYKPTINPAGEPMAQLLEAFLIAKELNKNDKPLYGCEVIGAIWRFVIMEDKNYCISKSFDCTDREDLLKIIAILRKFREILIHKLAV
jgi:hypothetical protein